MYVPAISLRKHINYMPSQDSVPCCTSCAVLLAIEISLAVNNIRLTLSRLFVYYMTRKMTNKLGEKGAELKDTLDMLVKYGVSRDALWPYTMNRVDREPHLPALEDAVHNRLYSYKSILPADYKKYLSKGIPIIVGIKTGKLFWGLRGALVDHRYKPVNGTDNRQTNGHAIVIIGYDDNINSGSWIIANSSGPSWGFHGYAAIPYECNIDIGESYVITNFAGTVIEKNS